MCTFCYPADLIQNTLEEDIIQQLIAVIPSTYSNGLISNFIVFNLHHGNSVSGGRAIKMKNCAEIKNQ